jgi:hypothetical protein
MTLRVCCWQAVKLPDNESCAEGCEVFPRCLPTLRLVRELRHRSGSENHSG